MALPAISLPPALSTLFLTLFVAITVLASRRGSARFLVASGAAVAIFFLALPAAHATDHVIINGDGCQVTEEDAIGIYLHSDLYLRIDFADSHWRFGLRNQGLKGLSLSMLRYRRPSSTRSSTSSSTLGWLTCLFPMWRSARMRQLSCIT